MPPHGPGRRHGDEVGPAVAAPGASRLFVFRTAKGRVVPGSPRIHRPASLGLSGRRFADRLWSAPSR